MAYDLAAFCPCCLLPLLLLPLLPPPLPLLLQPHAVTAKKMGVGACAWEGEMLLAAYLLSECTCSSGAFGWCALLLLLLLLALWHTVISELNCCAL
jgi:hypothetical protein